MYSRSGCVFKCVTSFYLSLVSLVNSRLTLGPGTLGVYFLTLPWSESNTKGVSLAANLNPGLSSYTAMGGSLTLYGCMGDVEERVNRAGVSIYLSVNTSQECSLHTESPSMCLSSRWPLWLHRGKTLTASGLRLLGLLNDSVSTIWDNYL